MAHPLSSQYSLDGFYFPPGKNPAEETQHVRTILQQYKYMPHGKKKGAVSIRLRFITNLRMIFEAVDYFGDFWGQPWFWSRIREVLDFIPCAVSEKNLEDIVNRYCLGRKNFLRRQQDSRTWEDCATSRIATLADRIINLSPSNAARFSWNEAARRWPQRRHSTLEDLGVLARQVREGHAAPQLRIRGLAGSEGPSLASRVTALQADDGRITSQSSELQARVAQPLQPPPSRSTAPRDAVQPATAGQEMRASRLDLPAAASKESSVPTGFSARLLATASKLTPPSLSAKPELPQNSILQRWKAEKIAQGAKENAVENNSNSTTVKIGVTALKGHDFSENQGSSKAHDQSPSLVGVKERHSKTSTSSAHYTTCDFFPRGLITGNANPVQEEPAQKEPLMVNSNDDVINLCSSGDEGSPTKPRSTSSIGLGLAPASKPPAGPHVPTVAQTRESLTCLYTRPNSVGKGKRPRAADFLECDPSPKRIATDTNVTASSAQPPSPGMIASPRKQSPLFVQESDSDLKRQKAVHNDSKAPEEIDGDMTLVDITAARKSSEMNDLPSTASVAQFIQKAIAETSTSSEVQDIDMSNQEILNHDPATNSPEHCLEKGPTVADQGQFDATDSAKSYTMVLDAKPSEQELTVQRVGRDQENASTIFNVLTERMVQTKRQQPRADNLAAEMIELREKSGKGNSDAIRLHFRDMQEQMKQQDALQQRTEILEAELKGLKQSSKINVYTVEAHLRDIKEQMKKQQAYQQRGDKLETQIQAIWAQLNECTPKKRTERIDSMLKAVQERLSSIPSEADRTSLTSTQLRTVHEMIAQRIAAATDNNNTRFLHIEGQLSRRSSDQQVPEKVESRLREIEKHLKQRGSEQKNLANVEKRIIAIEQCSDQRSTESQKLKEFEARLQNIEQQQHSVDIDVKVKVAVLEERLNKLPVEAQNTHDLEKLFHKIEQKSAVEVEARLAIIEEQLNRCSIEPNSADKFDSRLGNIEQQLGHYATLQKQIQELQEQMRQRPIDMKNPPTPPGRMPVDIALPSDSKHLHYLKTRDVKPFLDGLHDEINKLRRVVIGKIKEQDSGSEGLTKQNYMLDVLLMLERAMDAAKKGQLAL